MNTSNYILGSGLVSLLCRKILGDKWKIIPFGPSRFYSTEVPAWGDDFIIYGEKPKQIFDEWNLKTVPLIFNRGFNISGNILYNNSFIQNYFSKIQYEENPLYKDYFKTTFMVFPFSCIQLWTKLIREYITEIKAFYDNKPKISSIKDHKIILSNNEIIEYDNLISTIPYNILCKYMNINYECKNKDIYYYFINDTKTDLEKANQLLICDEIVPFHKCTKISTDKYLIEIIDKYFDNIYETLYSILGHEFDIIKANSIAKAHVVPDIIDNDILKINNITCIGSYAQCDPLMDISSCINRIYKLKI